MCTQWPPRGRKVPKIIYTDVCMVVGSTRKASPSVTGERVPHKEGITPKGRSLLPGSTRHMQMTLPGRCKYARKSPRRALNPVTLLQTANLCDTLPRKEITNYLQVHHFERWFCSNTTTEWSSWELTHS